MRSRHAEQHDAVIDTPFGRVGIGTRGAEVVAITYLPPDTPLRAPATAPAVEAAREIASYVDEPRHRLRLPLARAGTPFQQRVWAAIAAIPPGEARTYGDLARDLHSSARAVGQACGSNPYPLAVPCHRVRAATGIGGFAHARDGFLLGVKRWLLAHEGVRM